MAGDLTPAATPVVDGYLAELSGLLRGPLGRRRRIVAELRDGLLDAAEVRVADGMPAEQAEKEAVAAFGSPRLVAAAFAGELATAYARRTIAAYVFTGPLVGIWWLLLLQPHPWRTGLVALLVAIPVLPLLVFAIATAATTLATTGRLMRWLPETSPRFALSTTVALAGLVLVADLAVIAVYARSGIPLQPLGIVALAASMIRVGCGVFTVRRATTIRQGLVDAGP